MILFGLFEKALTQRRQCIIQQRLCRPTEFMMQGQRRVIRFNAHALLGGNRPGIRALHHAVQRHARFRFAVHQHPVQRRTTAIFWQQGTVQIVCPDGRGAEDLIAQQVAVVERENHIRRELLNTVHPQRMVYVIGSIHRDFAFGGDTCHRAKEVVLACGIRVSENRGDVITRFQKG
ncbi:hypothetical protein D3C72_534070 [compost metagenome]